MKDSNVSKSADMKICSAWLVRCKQISSTSTGRRNLARGESRLLFTSGCRRASSKINTPDHLLTSDQATARERLDH